MRAVQAKKRVTGHEGHMRVTSNKESVLGSSPRLVVNRIELQLDTKRHLYL